MFSDFTDPPSFLFIFPFLHFFCVNVFFGFLVIFRLFLAVSLSFSFYRFLCVLVTVTYPRKTNYNKVHPVQLHTHVKLTITKYILYVCIKIFSVNFYFLFKKYKIANMKNLHFSDENRF